MRMSCSGCRVLRKGCSDNCSIRPCLQWIKSPQAQANATVFLAKFYGRAGLINLIDAGPEHLRPAIFRSLLFEACGRMVNPIYGSAGLLWSGSWQLCQAAVEAVLKGAPIMQIPTEALATGPASPLHKASSCDIRHVAKEDTGVAAATAHDLYKVNAASRARIKRSANRCCNTNGGAGVEEPATAKRQCCAVDSHGSQASERSSTGGAAVPCEGDSRENETTLSMETAEAYSMVTSHGDANTGTADCRDAEDSDVELDLTLGFKSFHNRDSPHSTNSSSSSRRRRAHSPTCSSSRSSVAKAPKKCDDNRIEGSSGAMLAVDLRLDLAA